MRHQRETKPPAHEKSLAWKMIRDLAPLNRIFCSSDYDQALEYLQQMLPFEILEYQSDRPHNGWEIPPKWELITGTIHHNGQLVFEVTQPLQIIGLSAPFSGTVSLDELKKHLHYHHNNPDWIPYHFRQHYRPWERDWGFCVTQNFYDSLEEGEYEVRIETDESPGTLKIAEYTIEGEVPHCFTFVAHLDHPQMANDDLAGCAVGVEAFTELAKRKNKYSYRLILLQEITGSEYYLGVDSERSQDVLEACFLEMLGSDSKLALQHSLKGQTNLEYFLIESMKEMGIPFREGGFKEVICNDEAVWESHGFPMSSLSRFPYPEYHSDQDNISIIDPKALKQSVDLVLRCVDKLEQTALVMKQFQGTPCLSHPKYDLYVDPGQPAYGESDEQAKKMRLLMDLIPTLTRPTSVLRLAKEVGLDESIVQSYLLKWEAKGLIQIL